MNSTASDSGWGSRCAGLEPPAWPRAMRCLKRYWGRPARAPRNVSNRPGSARLAALLDVARQLPEQRNGLESNFPALHIVAGPPHPDSFAANFAAVVRT